MGESASKKEPAAKKVKKGESKKEEEGPAVEYKTVPCKKYWTIGHCELGPKCVYIHQEVSDAMAKQIVANNGELPPSVALSVPIKPIPNVGPRIFAVFRGVGAPVLRRGLVALLQLQSSPRVRAQNMMGTLVLAATARGGVLTTSCWIVKAEPLKYQCHAAPCQPVHISIADIMHLFIEILHFYVS